MIHKGYYFDLIIIQDVRGTLVHDRVPLRVIYTQLNYVPISTSSGPQRLISGTWFRQIHLFQTILYRYGWKKMDNRHQRKNDVTTSTE